MDRIIIHWTAGGHKANATDRKHYHILIEGDGREVLGNHPISANAGPLRKGKYAAHTRNLNTGSIGVAVCAMRGAKERPFNPGPSPITDKQMEQLPKTVRRLCETFGIPVTKHTVLTHAEVQPTLGVAQRSKWDITWLPGMEAPGDPVSVGDRLRYEIRFRPSNRGAQAPAPSPKRTVNPIGAAIAALAAAGAAVWAWVSNGGAP